MVTRGTDVVNVAHLGRRPNSAQRTALDWMNPTCTAMGCNRSVRLQTDHREDWADTKITLLSLLDGTVRAPSQPQDVQELGPGEGQGQTGDGARQGKMVYAEPVNALMPGLIAFRAATSFDEETSVRGGPGTVAAL